MHLIRKQWSARALRASRSVKLGMLKASDRGIMKTGISTSKNTRAWEHLFTGALFEGDQAKLLESIAQAESVLVMRAQQLAGPAEDNIEVLQALDDAMYVLHALRSVVPADEERAA
jgi:hypothetical protein